jgi:hypothetical protein
LEISTDDDVYIGFVVVVVDNDVSILSLSREYSIRWRSLFRAMDNHFLTAIPK